MEIKNQDAYSREKTFSVIVAIDNETATTRRYFVRRIRGGRSDPARQWRENFSVRSVFKITVWPHRRAK